MMGGGDAEMRGFMLGSPNVTIYRLHGVGLIFDDPIYTCKLLRRRCGEVANVPAICADGKQEQTPEIAGRV
jgi:hypothetical protein